MFAPKVAVEPVGGRGCGGATPPMVTRRAEAPPAPERRSPASFGLALVTTRWLADLWVTDVWSTTPAPYRAPAARSGPTAGALTFVHQREGSGRLDHESGWVELSAGECVLLRPDQPCGLRAHGPFRQICVDIPEWRLRERADLDLNPMLGEPLTSSPGIADILRVATHSLCLNEDAEASALARAEIFLDVLARSLQCLRRLDDRPRRSAARAGGERLRAFVAREFRNERLAPAHAAAALGCSVRNVHKLARASGASFGRMLMDVRLSAASLALAQPEDVRISDVAYGCGFGDLSHFSRVFKARFGMSPRGYRDTRR